MLATPSLVAGASPSRARTRSPGRMRAMLFVALANLALSCWIGTSYLDSLPSNPSPRLWWFAHAGLLSSILTLTLLPGSGLALAAISRISDRSFLVLQTLVWSFFQLTL